MDIEWRCSGCSQPLATDSKYAGEKMECPQCGKTVVAPGEQVTKSKKSQCSLCGNKVGLFSTYKVAGRGQLCKECALQEKQKQKAKEQAHIAFVSTYMDNAEKAETDARAAAWVALCHLVCAERVNIVHKVEHTLGGEVNEPEHSWEASKSKAIEFARKAMTLIPSNSAGTHFLQEILTRAQDLKACAADEIHTSSVSTAMGPFAHYEYLPEERAILVGDVSMNDLQDTILSLPGNEWLIVAEGGVEKYSAQPQSNVNTLISKLRDDDPKVRDKARKELEKVKAKSDIEVLIEALKNEKDWSLRANIAGILGTLGDPMVIEPLLLALKDNHSWVRISAAGALGDIGSASAVQPLIESLKDEDPDVRGTAAGALGDIGDKAAVEALIESLKDKASNVRRASLDALKKMTAEDFPLDHAKWKEWYDSQTNN